MVFAVNHPSVRLGLVMASLAGIGVALSADDDAEKWKQELAERARWWSLQAPAEWLPPDVSDPLWKEEPVDRFVYAKLEEQKLHPSEPADAETLARRLSFVLTGLPPKPERAAAFREAFANHPDTATTALVDELLRSPQFGERFARHWMDVVRYTDTYGYEWDIPAKGSWEYRDYLIRAFNEDVGFDQLIREQVAGDLLPHPRINAEAGLNESMIGPMFYHMGEHRHGSSLAFNGIHQEMIDNKIDAFSKAFLGMTVACARCHDHKLDAISQADYYALAGVFMTPRWTARSIDAPGKNAAALKELKRLRREIERRLAEVWGEAARGGLLSAGNLKDWATTNRASLDSSKVEGIEYLFGEIVDRPGAETWRELASEWKRTSDTRRTTNAENFTLISDFSQPGFPENWVMEGEGLLEGYVSDGTLLIGLEGKDLVSEFLPRGYHTHSLSSKLAGALRLPEPERFPKTKVSLELKGGEWAGYRAIPQNAFLNESPFFFDPSASAKWTTFAPSELKNGVTRVLTEITTASLNSNFPPRTGVARAGKVTLPNEDEGWDKRSWFSVTGIVAHDSAGTPADTLDTFALLYEGPPPETAEDDWQRLSDWLTATVNRWSVGDSRPGDVQILNWLLEKGFLPNDAETYPGVGAMVDRYREIEAGIEFPRSANSMDERAVEPVDYRLNVRGNVYEEGSKIHRNFLEVFEGRHEVAMAKGSGRLELAHYLSSRENPQTARVYVNRVWQWIFGSGIVQTPSDFGKLGGRPSHPELLDWLALQFMEDGWSTKTLVRRLVLSRTFRQSSFVSEVGADRDADNRLLHHYPTRRLEAEAIRDSLLAVSGRLDSRLYGHPINPPRTAEDDKKRLFSGPLDGKGRRSIYLEMSIMQPPEFLVGYNLPDLKLPTGRRDVTNVPAQALIMLNDPFVTAMADYWAGTLLKDASKTPPERIRAMFWSAFGRAPSGDEERRWVDALRDFSSESNVMTDPRAWSEIAHALFNTKEFLYYR